MKASVPVKDLAWNKMVSMLELKFSSSSTFIESIKVVVREGAFQYEASEEVRG